MTGSIPRFWSLCPAAAAAALCALLAAPAAAAPAVRSDGAAGGGWESLTAAGDPLTGQVGGKRERRKKDKDKGDDKSGKDKDGKGKDKPKEPPFEKVVKDATVHKGLFNVYVKEDEGKYLLEISPDQFDEPFLLNPTLVSGLGQGFVYPADVLQEYVVSFHRAGKRVQLIHRNTMFRADEGSTLREPASLAAPDAVVGQGKILSRPHPDRKSVLVDLGSIFLGDLEGLSPYLKALFELPFQFDRERSSVARVKAFPHNVDLETVLHFRTNDVKRPVVYAADPRSLLFRFYYSISELPDTGYRPRLADDRVGHFLAMAGDYSSDRPEDPHLRYVTRWHLEKADPSAEISEPKQPIVFYLDRSIPVAYREAVRQGILRWNPAFEAIGFRNAVVAKDPPDDPDWDPADVRYSSIRWIVAPHAGFAQGPSRIDPYTGQIYDADIRFSADMIRNVRREAGELVAPLAWPLPPGTGSTGTAALLKRLEGWTALLGPFSPETLLASTPGLGEAPPPMLGAGARPGLPPAALGHCDYARGLRHQLSLGWSLLRARGLMDPETEENYVNDFLIHVTLHEVGHTLGLRHNFKASKIHSLAEVQDVEMTERIGLTGSVMDYTPVNLAFEGQTQGQYWQTTIGPYDRFAIEYAYKPIDSATIQGERPELERIASRAADPTLAYATDEDTFTGSPRGMDPDSSMWDIGDEILEYYTHRIGLARELFSVMDEKFSEPGTRYQKLLLVFGQGFGELLPAALNVPKYVGGIRHHRDHIGDPNGRVPYDPVAAAEQRAALRFLTREIFAPDAFRLPPALLNKLAVERLPDPEGVFWTRARNDLPIHDLVLLVQSLPIDRLYHPITLSRLSDLEAHYESASEAFTMAEMFSGMRRAIWQELADRSNINSFRRNLQRKHLDTLIGILLQAGPATIPADARTLARADLTAIRSGIDSVLGREGAGLDAVTRAHLDEARARITAALDADMEFRAPGPTRG
ncbi:MAG: zinc-dependent metalloprotease [Acidobacteriota bacterium]